MIFVAVEGTFVRFTKGHDHSARRQRIAPFDLRGASLPVSGAISIMFLETLCSKNWYDMLHIGCGIHSL